MKRFNMSGKDTLSNSHVREGIVIKSLVRDRHPTLGRSIGKFVSPSYLLRKNPDATEFS